MSVPMKTAITHLFTALLGVALLGSANLMAQDFYDINTIHEIELIFQESNWDQILDSYYAAGDEQRLMGTAVIDGVTYDSVGVRYKGNSSYRPEQVKNPFNIKLDYIIDDQTIDGYGTLKLANAFQDPSFMREVLSYEIARKYMPASKANYMKVTVNGTYIGLYASVQDVDKFFAQTHFYTGDYARFKGDPVNSTPQSRTPVWTYRGADSTAYYNYYELESDSGWKYLVAFLDTFNNYSNQMEEVLNIDRHIWMLAFDNLLVNLDAPINFCHNYYLFEDGSRRFNPILWDLNQNFGSFTQILSTGEQLSATGLQQLDPYLHSSNSDFPIVMKVLNIPTYKRMYIAHMKTMIEENFTNGWLETRGLEIQSIIATEVQNDPNKFYTYANFIDNLYTTAGGGMGGGVVGLLYLMDARVSYLSSLADFTASQPTVGTIAVSPASPTAYSTVWLTAAVSNADSVLLGYRQNIAGRFTKVMMYDDGSHNDGSAGDGVYGASVELSSGDFQYYIYAENDNAGIFSPTRAEFEYYSVEVTGLSVVDLSINEFMASNAASYADQDGEYDDWLEIYNGTDSSITLNGYYLTDNPLSLTKWAFPDTAIGAGEFMLIWADEDGEQEGLHTSFKLSASGETIMLINAALETVDQITFEAQSTDTSYGRYPNGTDNWQFFATPTPGASNGGSTNTPPEIEWTIQTPEYVTDADTVYVLSRISDESGIFNVLLDYYIGAVHVVTGMYDDGDHGDSLDGDGVYGMSIEPQASGTIVEYCVIAYDDSGASTTDPVNPSVLRYTYEVGAEQIPVRINELMAENDTTIQDPDGLGGYPDWFELYNGGTETIDLGGMYLTDDFAEPTMFQIPAGVTIGPGEYLLFWADNDTDQGDTHTNFKLSADGEAIGLFDTDANGNRVIDTITFGIQTADVSYGRYPDGTDNLQYFTIPTPGATNVEGTSNVAPVIDWTMQTPDVVTETDTVYISARAYDENGIANVTLDYYIGSIHTITSMYNDGNHADSLAGDSVYGMWIPPCPVGTIVEYCVIAYDDSGASTSDPVDPQTMRYSYEVGEEGTSIYINELMADNETTIEDPDEAGEFADWFELYNGGTTAIDLGGMYLTDDFTEPTMFQIPAGISIDPGEFVLFWADDDTEQGDLHTNFKLGTDGEAIGLFDTDANGNRVIDTLTFAVQTTDVSYGRCPDGGNIRESFSSPSPGDANICSSAICGDANADGAVNLLDILALIEFIYQDGEEPEKLDMADVNSDEAVNLLDILALIDHVYVNGYELNC